MTITREINGEQVSIELTMDELFEAYREAEWRYDSDDVKNYLELYGDEDFKNDYGIDISVAVEHVDEIGSMLRKLIDKYGMSWEDARDGAVGEWLDCRIADKTDLTL